MLIADVPAPRLIVFEYEPEYDLCASVRDVVEGDREFIEEYIRDNYPEAPVVLRSDRPNDGEMYLFEDTSESAIPRSAPVGWPAGKSASETYDLLLKAATEPPPCFDDIKPEIWIGEIINILLDGKIKAFEGRPFEVYQGKGETLSGMKVKGTLMLWVKSDRGNWEVDIHRGSFKRIF